MKRFFKTTATAILVALSFVVLVDSFVCQEENGREAGAPAECCMQCCPRHNLAPPAANLDQTLSDSTFEKSFIVEFIPTSALLVDSIFHPPKTALL